MLAPVESSHAAVGLVPDAEVLELGKDRLACLEQFPHMAPIHAHERNGAVARKRGGMPQCLLQEAGECFGRHFADPHGEFAVADATQPCHMPIDWDVVRRIREDEVRPFVPHQKVEDALVSRISANQTMPTKTPHSARARDSGCLIIDREGDLILGLGRTVRRALARLIEHKVDFSGREASEVNVEIDVDEALQLDRQQLPVPSGVEGELVVGQHIGAPLSRAQMSQAHRRDAVQAEQLCGLDPAVAGNDLAVLSDQNWIGEAEPPDAVGDLPDLLLGMGSGIAGMRPQARDQHRFDGTRKWELFHRYLATVGRDAPGGIARLRADDGVALRHGWGVAGGSYSAAIGEAFVTRLARARIMAVESAILA
jgi:hypothetical protein